MGEGIKYGAGGASNVLNGVIAEYYAATDDVNPSTFVEYISKYGVGAIGTAVKIHTQASTWPRSIRAVQLEENKIFVAFSGYLGSTTIIGAILTVSNNIVTVASTKAIETSNSTYYSAEQLDVVALSSSKVFLVYGDVESVNQISGKVCSISGTTITAGSAATIHFAPSTSDILGRTCAALSSTKAVVAYTAEGKVWSVVCTISGTTVTVGTPVTVATDAYSTANSYYMVELAGLSSAKFCLFYINSSSKCCSMVCTVSGTSITAGTATALRNASASPGGMNAAVLSDGRVLLAVIYSSAVYVLLLSISGTSTTVVATVTGMASTVNGMSLAVLSDNFAVLAAQKTSYSVVTSLLKISGNTITVGSPTIIKSSSGGNYQNMFCSVAKAQDNAVLIAFSMYDSSDGNYYPHAIACDVEAYEGITPLTSSSKFLGLTCTKATKKSKGKVWVLR